MEKIEVRPKFTEWVQSKTNTNVSELHPFLQACFEEEIDLTLNSSFNGIPFYQHYPVQELMTSMLEGWYSTAKSFLQLQDSNVSLSFKNVPVPSGEERKRLLSTMTDLVSKCLPDLQKN